MSSLRSFNPPQCSPISASAAMFFEMNKPVKKPKPINSELIEDSGVPLEVARVYEAMKKSPYFKKPRYIAEMNYAINSSKPRFFVYDTQKGVLYKLKAAHGVGGKNGTPNDGKCREVSNRNGSHMSCLGLFKCAEVYNGNNGRSMRLDGLEATNGNARMRAVVIHGSDYVKESSNAPAGRSFGCPALDRAVSDKVIDMLKGGSPLLSHYNGANKI